MKRIDQIIKDYHLSPEQAKRLRKLKMNMTLSAIAVAIATVAVLIFTIHYFIK